MRVGVAQPQHLRVVDLPVAGADAGEGVEVLRLHGDAQRLADLLPLALRRPRHVAVDVVTDDRVVEAVGAQRAGGAGRLGLGHELRVVTAQIARGAGRQRVLQ